MARGPPPLSADALVHAPGMPLHDADIDALEQPVQLLHRQRRYVRLAGPDEPVLFQPFEQQPEPVAVPAQHLHPVAPAVAEHVHARGERVQSQRLLHQCRQAIDVQPEVHRCAVQVDLQAFVEAEHRSLPKDSITSPTCRASTPRRSTATPLGRRACRLITAGALSSPSSAAPGVATSGTTMNAGGVGTLVTAMRERRPWLLPQPAADLVGIDPALARPTRH